MTLAGAEDDLVEPDAVAVLADDRVDDDRVEDRHRDDEEQRRDEDRLRQRLEVEPVEVAPPLEVEPPEREHREREHDDPRQRLPQQPVIAMGKVPVEPELEGDVVRERDQRAVDRHLGKRVTAHRDARRADPAHRSC